MFTQNVQQLAAVGSVEIPRKNKALGHSQVNTCYACL